MRTAFSEGSARASSMELVWRLWVPPSTAARAWMVTRTMLFSGCSAVREQPAVWVWNRISMLLGSLAPKVSFISRAQMRRAARYLAISSNRSLWALKKKLNRGATESMSRPRSTAHLAYSRPSRRVKASSWMAVEPASLMW